MTSSWAAEHECITRQMLSAGNGFDSRGLLLLATCLVSIQPHKTATRLFCTPRTKKPKACNNQWVLFHWTVQLTSLGLMKFSHTIFLVQSDLISREVSFAHNIYISMSNRSDLAESTPISLPPSLQNVKTIGQLSNTLWTNIPREIWVNSLRAKFFRGNINIYLHFMSFLHTNKTQVVEIPRRVRQGPVYST